MNVDKGEFIANMGASGSGKTTLLGMLFQLLIKHKWSYLY